MGTRVQSGGENYIMRSLIICTPLYSLLLLGVIKTRIGWAGHVAGIWRKDTLRVLVGRPEGKRKDPGVDGSSIVKSIFNTWSGDAWSGLLWLRIGTGGGLL
jgi:hypothetical protein